MRIFHIAMFNLPKHRWCNLSGKLSCYQNDVPEDDVMEYSGDEESESSSEDETDKRIGEYFCSLSYIQHTIISQA